MPLIAASLKPKPFIWLYQATYYLFVREGVYELPSKWRHADFRCIVWTFVDSDQNTGVSGSFSFPKARASSLYCHVSGQNGGRV